jgi:hypothetical protein
MGSIVNFMRMTRLSHRQMHNMGIEGVKHVPTQA